MSVVNLLQLHASIVEVEPLRYTPAGLPALNLLLEHASEQAEAGGKRAVKLALKSVALGVISERLAVQSLGSSWEFTGFMSNAARGKALVFHIQDFYKIH